VKKLATFLRMLRLQNGQVLKDMADLLGVSSAFLSAVENGKKKMPSDWYEKLRESYGLNDEQYDNLKQLAMESQKTISLNLEDTSDSKRQLAATFARQFNDLDESVCGLIMDILERRRKKGK